MSNPIVPTAPIPGLKLEQVLDCVHCGICLSVCPTFDILGTEADSPRGRIYYIRALAEGKTDLNPTLVGHLDSCLGCRACETACPSAVQYGEMLVHVRDAIEKQFPRSPQERLSRGVLLELLTRPDRLAPAMFGAALGEKLGFGGMVRAANHFLFGPDAPEMPLPHDATPSVVPLPAYTYAKGERRATVAILPGCVMQVLFQRVNLATIRVLAANGCDVVVPNVGCCGALHEHNGALDGARARAKEAIRALEAAHVDAIVVNSAGCGATMKQYGHLLADDPYWKERGEAIAARTMDASEFLVKLGPIAPTHSVDRRVTYHDACHLAHAQKIRTEPRALLKLIPGLSLVELPNSDWCCGSAGIYNFLQPELATQLQEKKVGHVLSTQPEILVTGNPGCHAWIEAGLKSRNAPVEVLHTMELLDRAYQG